MHTRTDTRTQNDLMLYAGGAIFERIAMSLEPWHWSHVIGAMSLEPCHWSHVIGAMSLEPCHWSHGIGAMSLEPCHWSHVIGAMSLEPWHWSHVIGAMSLEPCHWSHVIGAMSLEPCHWHLHSMAVPNDFKLKKSLYGTVSAKIAPRLKCHKNASRLNRYFPTELSTFYFQHFIVKWCSMNC